MRKTFAQKIYETSVINDKLNREEALKMAVKKIKKGLNYRARKGGFDLQVVVREETLRYCTLEELAEEIEKLGFSWVGIREQCNRIVIRWGKEEE